MSHRNIAFALFKRAGPDQPWGVADPEGRSLGHAMWMLQWIWNGNVTADKADRWIGWAACLLVMHDRMSLEDVKGIIREQTSNDACGEQHQKARNETRRQAG